MNDKFTKLRNGHILGIIDSYGAVHSAFTGEHLAFHSNYFPATHCHWRWCNNRSIHWFTGENKPKADEYDAIRNHLTKRYGLQWWENGHHDLDHLNQKCQEEDFQNKNA